MSFPIILLVGQAGSGKDTVADAIGGQKMALADPMKRLARAIFDFTEDQLWGPSESRNALDPVWTPTKLTAFRGEVAASMSSAVNEPTPLPARLYAGPAHNILAQLLNGNSYNERFNTWLLGVLDNALVKGLTPRYVLQTMGTEFGRSINSDMWINEGIATALRLLDGEHCFYDKAKGIVPAKSHGHKTDLVVISDGRFRNEVLNVKRQGGLVIKVVREGATGSPSGGASGHASEAEQKTIPDTWFDSIIYNDRSLESLRAAAVSVSKALQAPLRILASGYSRPGAP